MGTRKATGAGYFCVKLRVEGTGGRAAGRVALILLGLALGVLLAQVVAQALSGVLELPKVLSRPSAAVLPATAPLGNTGAPPCASGRPASRGQARASETPSKRP
jgi:hypothetical protein